MKLREGIGFPSTCRELLPYRRPPCWQDANGFYQLLGLSPAATDEEVRKAGRDLLRRFHPDGTEPDPDKFLEVEEAYRVLTTERVVYDSTPSGHVMVTEGNKFDSELTPVSPTYSGWSYFSEVPRVTDDSVALWAYEQYLAQALSTPTTLPRVSVALIQGSGDPWIDDGLIYVPMSDIQGRIDSTSGANSEARRQG